MSLFNSPTLLIPAAGFGTRVGSPPSKELYLRPDSNETLISGAIRWGEERHWPIVIITRRDKTVLNEYLFKNHPKVEVVIIDKSEDWQSSVLQSYESWGEHNILILPDVEFEPLSILDDIAKELNIYDIVGACHKVNDQENWGHIWKVNDNEYAVFEKPLTSLNINTSNLNSFKFIDYVQKSSAWGILGFRKKHGRKLLEAQWQSQREQFAVQVSGSFKLLELNKFVDLTR